MDAFLESISNFAAHPFTTDISLTTLLILAVILVVVGWIVVDIMNLIAEGAI